MLKLPTFDKEADVPKPFAALYEERDGKWHPKADDAGDDLAAELAEERRLRDAAEKGATKTANELKKLERKLAAKASDLPEEVVEKMRGEIRKEIEEEYAPKFADAERHATENRSLKLDGAVKAIAAKAKFLPEKLDDLWKLHRDEFDLSADGKPIVKGKPGTDIEKHIAALAKLRPEWVQGTKAGGSGALGGAGDAAGPSGVTFETLMKDPGGVLAAANVKA